MNTGKNSNKWALLIGINRYPKVIQLRGCINDIDLMAGILNDNFGFPDKNIQLLKDEQATREGILEAMYGLVERVMENDIVVVHYSGHGSRRRDFEGDEPDGYDETIVPYDSGRAPYPNLDITDDEIHAWLLKLTKNTDYVSLIFDSCHSGSITRDVFGTKIRWIEPDLRTAEEMGVKPLEPDITRKSSRDVGPSGWLPLGERYVLISGCRDDESANEHTVRQNGNEVDYGALTYFLSQELTKAVSGATYRDVFERACTQVTASYNRQHPQMEGARDRVLFGVHDVNTMRFVSVKNRSLDKVILGAGAAHGMTIGSQWSIYPQATKQVPTETPELGLVEVTSVRAVTADAKILKESEAGVIEPNTRAFEEAHFYGEMLLVVDIQAPEGYEEAAKELEKRIEESKLLRLARNGESADTRVYILAPRLKVTEGDPVPQLGSIIKATWAVVKQDGRLMMPIHLVEKGDAVSKLSKNLEEAARYKHALALRNPNNDSPLRGKIDFMLLRQTPDGSWVRAEQDDTNGQIIFKTGERIAFKIVNNYISSIYVSVLDFGLKGAISLLHPIEGASEQLVPGREISVGDRDDDVIKLSFPDGFAEMADPYDKLPIGGVEAFKLIATTHEADFSPLTQEGYREASLKGVGTPLIKLMDIALTGFGTRDGIRTRVNPNEEWTTIERSFFLQAKNASDLEKARYPEQTIIPDFAIKDFTVDAPWRVQSKEIAIPIHVYIKDADKQPFTLQNIKVYKKGQDNPILVYDPVPDLRIDSPKWSYFFSGRDLVVGKHGNSLTAKDFGVGPAGFIDIVVIIAVKYQPDIKQRLKIYVAEDPLPALDNWHYGDTHFHSEFTANPKEFGGLLDMTSQCMKAIGLSWVTATDHSPDYGLETPAGLPSHFDMSRAKIRWTDADKKFSSYPEIIKAEELTPFIEEVYSGIGLHILYYGSEYIHEDDTGKIFVSKLINSLNQVSAGGIIYAAHPDDKGFYWEDRHLDAALNFGVFKGSELWNTRSTVKAGKDRDPFDHWEVHGDWDKENLIQKSLKNGIKRWDRYLSKCISPSFPESRMQIFSSGGSDAHGDFNYFRNNQFITPTEATDNAFGKIRTVIYCTGELSKENILEAIKNGRSVVTDGPLVVFGLDTDSDGKVDVNIGDKSVINMQEAGSMKWCIQWNTTPEFGRTIAKYRLLRGSSSTGDNPELILEENSVGACGSNTNIALSVKMPQQDGWYYYRVEAKTECVIDHRTGLDTIYRCYTNPIWIKFVKAS